MEISGQDKIKKMFISFVSEKMKEAAMLLMMLWLWWFASQSSAFGFSLQVPPKTIQQAIYNQIDHIYETDPSRLANINGKLPSIMRHYQDKPRDYELLTNIQSYLDYKLNEPTDQELSSAIITALGSLFN